MLEIVAIYDAPEFADRYTIYVKERGVSLSGPAAVGLDCLGLSDNPTNPLGFSQWSSGQLGPHNGRKITLEQLPEAVRKHALARING